MQQQWRTRTSSSSHLSFISASNPTINGFTRDTFSSNVYLCLSYTQGFLICNTIVSLGDAAKLYRGSWMLHPKFMAQNASKAQPCCMAKPSSRKENLARSRVLCHSILGWDGGAKKAHRKWMALSRLINPLETSQWNLCETSQDSVLRRKFNSKPSYWVFGYTVVHQIICKL